MIVNFPNVFAPDSSPEETVRHHRCISMVGGRGYHVLMFRCRKFLPRHKVTEEERESLRSFFTNKTNIRL